MKKFIVEQVMGDGAYKKVAASGSERAACKKALDLFVAHEMAYGQALKSTVTGHTVGKCRVICPDGSVLSGVDLQVGAI